MKTFLADTHVHVYPEHQPARVFDSVWRNLQPAMGTDTAAVGAFLVEVAGVRYFRALVEGRERLSSCYTVDVIDECALRLLSSAGGAEPCPVIWCFSGRQIVTRERVEILALVSDLEMEDGLPAAQVVQRILDQGGIPVLAWGLGKWLLGRSRVVRSLVEQFDADQLWIGDNAIRPVGWPPAAPFRDPARRLLAGSDPLPFASEERMAGTYGVRFPGAIDEVAPTESARALLRSPPSQLERVGRRNHLLATGQRMWRYQRRKPTK